jgi:cell shape-determining protein MreD
MKLKDTLKQNISYFTNVIIFLGLLSFQTQQLLIGLRLDIFPAIEMILFFHLSINKKLNYWQCFFIGLICDQLNSITLGINAILFICSEYILRKAILYFTSQKNSFTELLIFYAYAAIFILLKYILIISNGINALDMMTLFFYFLTTIFSYPLIKSFAENIIS